MALENFIPALWSGQLLQSLETALVYGSPGVINRDYEGTFSQGGDTVRINSIGDPTVSTYTKNSDLSSPETLTDAQTILTIDQTPSINFQVDNIDAAQQNPKVMAEAMQRGGYVLRKNVDTYLAGLYTAIPSGNTLSKTVGVAGGDSNAYQQLVALARLLDENDVPEQGRWAVVPPWYEALLLMDDRFTKYGTAPTNARLVAGAIDPGMPVNTGYCGEVAGMAIYKSNNIKKPSSVYQVMAGHPMSWTLAIQLSKVQAYQPEKRFGDAVKALLLYGAKVIRPNQMALLQATQGTLS